MATLIFWLAVFVIGAIAVFYILSQLQLSEPYSRIVTVAVVAVIAILAIYFLVQFAGGIPAIPK